ncbi:GH1 family beta-glucosidase [Hydrogenophaga sp. SL48]|uniref:GH1 family beta-glucosidase n=1 Tax=Hydrogenophaga sp. SL48 TaxID=2806347 RepID=UPI001F012EDF|nr:GH1 family beta-glucosidase [Hydrogenophaga sp. SL48]UJW80703.1 beta-glucosidase [Hydrogenophaga sp. SL48]
MTDGLIFPAAFEWGCATAAFQIEGGGREGGKLPSIWDDFCAQPGRIKDASDGMVACDHYHRYPEDVALMASLGFRHYRFSIAWTRVVNAQGRANQAGLDFYRRLLDQLQQHGITPNATLFHWDLPSHLEGGWLNRDTAHRFADYAALVARELGDRLPRVATLNEPWCSAFLGHDVGVFAPGVQDREASLLAAHHLMLAHGLGVQAWRAVRSDTSLGIVLNPELCDPFSGAPADAAAARMAELERNHVFLNPLFGREWPAEMLAQIGSRAENRRAGDLAICAQPLDFIGLNYYTRSVARAPVSQGDAVRGYTFVAPDGDQLPLTDIGWEIYPVGLRRVVENLLNEWPLPPIWITENGAADNTGVANGECHDETRLRYLQTHLTQLAAMVAAGIDIRGYYVWSLLDNFEWAHGYTQRFGMVHVDYATQARTPKHSARWLQALMQRHVTTPA